MTRLREDSGFTLIELLIAAVVMLVILTASLTAFTTMQRQRVFVDRLADAEQQARQGADRMARQLRNLASPGASISLASSTKPNSIDRNLPYDLVFKDVDEQGPVLATNPANVRRVRYCLQTSGAIGSSSESASSTRGALIQQTQRTSAALPTLPDAAPASLACPAPGWGTTRVVADHLTNAGSAPARPLFRYSSSAGEVTGTDDLARPEITRVEATLQVDPDPTRSPLASRLTTSVVLRNQNRAPRAGIEVTVLNSLSCTVQLNGSGSEDPENKRLKYTWYDNDVPIAGTEDRVVVQQQFAKTTHVFKLEVTDPAELSDTFTAPPITCA